MILNRPIAAYGRPEGPLSMAGNPCSCPKSALVLSLLKLFFERKKLYFTNFSDRKFEPAPQHTLYMMDQGSISSILSNVLMSGLAARAKEKRRDPQSCLSRERTDSVESFFPCSGQTPKILRRGSLLLFSWPGHEGQAEPSRLAQHILLDQIGLQVDSI